MTRKDKLYKEIKAHFASGGKNETGLDLSRVLKRHSSVIQIRQRKYDGPVEMTFDGKSWHDPEQWMQLYDFNLENEISQFVSRMGAIGKTINALKTTVNDKTKSVVNSSVPNKGGENVTIKEQVQASATQTVKATTNPTAVQKVNVAKTQVEAKQEVEPAKCVDPMKSPDPAVRKAAMDKQAAENRAKFNSIMNQGLTQTF